VSDVLRAQVRRPSDLLARYGGEEFVVVLPETALSGALELAEGMRQAVADLHMEHKQSPIAPHVTISLGVAELFPKGHKSDDLFILADAALYQAKEKGRNRVESAA
jgi:diguanylate cyclase (GGDEF)-like protein